MDRIEAGFPARPPFDAAGEAKLLLRSTRSAALATLADGYPFATLVNVATDYDGGPILLLSGLAAHTGHLAADSRLSLLLSRGGRGDPLAHPRLTVLGQTERVECHPRRSALRRRFLARHPKAALYADFADFAFYKVLIERAHLNGGFARAAALAAEDLLTPLSDTASLLAAEPAEVGRINKDHPEIAGLLAQAFGRRRAGPWIATGFDPEGLDLAKGDDICRVTFPKSVISEAELQRVLMDLVAEARRCLASEQPAGAPRPKQL